MNFRPLYDRITIRPKAAEEVRASGIIIPDQAQEKPNEGTVVSVGHGRLLENGQVVPLQLVGGEQVLYGKYAGTEVKIDGEKLLIMRENEVLGVLGQ